MKLIRDFYEKDARLLAKDLLGKVLVHKIDDILLKGKIIETEAYIGAIDKASHAYGGRMTQRVAPLYGPAGTVYVYFVYGMHYCFNIVAGQEGMAEGVLIRALEPLYNVDYMSQARFNKNYCELTKTQIKNLTNGPAKLCAAMKIGKNNNWQNVIENDELYLEEPNYSDTLDLKDIVVTKRIGIDYAEEAIDFPWRFYIKGNNWVSRL